MRRYSRIITLLLILVFMSSQPVAASTHRVSKAELQKLADKAVKNGLVGVSLAVYMPNDGMFLVTSGVSDRKTKAKLQTTDIARIASASKVWVGTVVMQLVQEGKLSLSDKIQKYIGKANAQHIANADSATIEQLLTHTSGILDYYNDADFGQDVPNKMDFTIDEALKYIWDKPAVFSPGKKYAYSNSNTVLLAQAVETITGKPIAQVMRSRIFEPLGLKNTYIEVFEPVPVKIVHGYQFDGDDVTEIGDKYQGGGLPDGGIVTSPEDMVKFMRALFVDGKLLNKGTMERMVAPRADTGDGSGIGYHIFITETGNGKRYEHDGGIDGYTAMEMHYADLDITIAYWTNSAGEEQDEAIQTFQDDVLSLVVDR